jgi:Tol biopolymer transport system component
VDKRTDTWALGCVLYEMLTGKAAFGGEDVTEILASVVKSEPNWSLLPAATPAPIRTLLRRCLQKDPKRRLDSAAVVRLEIDEALTTPASETSPLVVSAPAKPLWRHVGSIMALALLAAAIGGAAVWIMRPSALPPTVARFSFALPKGQQFTSTSREVVAISPNGRDLVYVANSRLYLRSISELEARAIPGTEIKEGIYNPVFSPDGQSIAFFADNTLKRVAVGGGTPVTICSARAPFGMSWGPDGIVFGQGGGAGIMRVSPNGGKPERLVAVKEGENAGHPQMLAGGQAVLFSFFHSKFIRGVDEAQVVVQSLKSGERKILVNAGSDAHYLPSGHIVYTLGGTLFAIPFDLERLEVSGGPVPVVEGVRRDAVTGIAQLSVSSTGLLVYVPGPAGSGAQGRRLMLADRNGASVALPLAPGLYVHPRVSRDGSRLAVGIDNGQEANVWIYELAGTSALRRLTFGGHNRFPIWSADGQWVAFQSDREGDLAIFWQRADGTGTPERLTKPDQGAAHVPESSSPDGRRLMFAVTKDSTFSLQTLSLDDRKATPFGEVWSAEPIGAVFSPDGRWVAYSSNPQQGGAPSPNRGVYVQPFPPTGARYQIPSSRNDFHPVWRPDGAALFYIPLAGRLAEVSLQTGPSFTFGRTVGLPGPLMQDSRSSELRDYDILPDGRFIGFVAGQDTSGNAGEPEIRLVLNWFEELRQRVPVR